MNYNNINLCIAGSGRWGKNHIKTAFKILGPDKLTVFDINHETIDFVNNLSPKINFTSVIEKCLIDKAINAVIISTPAETHFELAKLFLKSDKNVLVEKPMTLTVKESEILNEIAQHKGLKLMVGHILLFHPAVIKMKELIDDNCIGKLQYIYSNRLNLGTVRQEENILWSFAPHDISVIQYLIGKPPENVYATGSKFLQENIEDTTITILKYPDNIHAHIFVSWLHPFKEQRLVVIGDKGMLVFEDSLKDGKLKFHKKGFQNVNGVLEKFDENFEVIQYSEKPPLEEEQKHFFNCILNNENPITNGESAIEVLKILELSQKSLV
jgi:UDP-2-acetamido-3-amino-2,3-dideoxy-glucuronate N-acetyltransferase